MKRFLLALPLLLSLIAGCALLTTDDGANRPPNLILVVADDLGYGDLGCYGQERIATPHLDRLAADGLRFTQFYAGSTVCAPSRCALMTGQHTGHCPIRGNAVQDLEPDDVTIAEVLREAGYATGLVGKWGIGHEGSDGMPTRQGFDSFFGYLDQAHAHNYYPRFLIRDEERVLLPNVVPEEGKRGQGVATEKVVYSHDLVTDEALAFLEREQGGPFFLFVAWTLPHANNEARREGMEVPELGEFADEEWPDPEKGFAAMVTRLDRDLGRIRAKLEELGLAENTILLFTSDNGPHQEGGHQAEFFESSGILRGQKRDLLEGGIRVPTIAWGPGRVPAGESTDRVAAFWDIMPTFAAFAGVEAALPEEIDGVSFAPSLLGTETVRGEEHPLYWAFYEGKMGRAIRRGRWKAIEQPMPSAIRLYDLDVDCAEEADLAAEHPEVVDALRAEMERQDTPCERWKFRAPTEEKQ